MVPPLAAAGRLAQSPAPMQPAELFASLNIPEAAAQSLRPHWESSAATLPAGLPRGLEAGRIRWARQQAGLPATADAALLQAARRIVASAPLRFLFWHCQRLLYDHADYAAYENLRQWPFPLADLAQRTGAFYLLVGLEAVARTRDLHRRLRIPLEVTGATCQVHFEPWVQVFDQLHGGVGLRPRNLYWLRNYTSGELFRLGRHEYMVRPFRGGLTAYRHRQTRRVVALAAGGTGFDDDGLIPPDDRDVTWTSQRVDTADSVTGTPISPRGHAERRRVTLARCDWEPALTPGDGILEVHIPEGGDMTPARCLDSMRRAVEFFSRHFPERGFVGFACGSWILNPQLATIYRPDANMVLWQRELYLYPTRSGPRSGLHFVFGTDDVDVAAAPRDTSLRRALLDHLAAGGILRGGGMFLLLEDFPRYGEQVYRAAADDDGGDTR